MSRRIKIVERQMKKMECLTHVKKLEQLSSQKNHFHKSLRKQRQEIINLIKQSHKIHMNGLKSLSKIKDLSVANTQRSNYENVKSVVKLELDRRILTIPSKHKPDPFERQMTNIKMVNKILNAKSQFDFKRQAIQNISKRVTKQKLDTSQDYSRLYENLFQNHIKQKKIRLFLSKDKHNVRLIVKLMDQQNIFQTKTNNPYVIVIQNAREQKQSKYYSLDQLNISQFIFQVPPIQCRISFVQLINQKRIPRFKLIINEEEYSTLKQKAMTKEVYDTKDRVVGLASIELKKKKSKKSSKQINNNKLNILLTQQLENTEKTSEINDKQANSCIP